MRVRVHVCERVRACVRASVRVTIHSLMATYRIQPKPVSHLRNIDATMRASNVSGYINVWYLL